jgi:hypothetical protein
MRRLRPAYAGLEWMVEQEANHLAGRAGDIVYAKASSPRELIWTVK